MRSCSLAVLLETRILQHLLHWTQGVLEKVIVDLLEASSGKGLREIHTIIQSLNFDSGLVCGAQSTLGLLNLAAQLLQRTLVLGHIFAVLLVENLNKMLHDTLIEVLTTEMCVAVCCNDLEHTVVDCQKRHIEGATTKIVHKNVLLR